MMRKFSGSVVANDPLSVDMTGHLAHVVANNLLYVDVTGNLAYVVLSSLDVT